MSKPKKVKDTRKERFIEYFKQLPVQRLAAAHIGVNEDTISRWKGEDQDFAEQIEHAKAEWALENVKDVKSKEWLLERLMRDPFGKEELVGQYNQQNNFYNLNDEQLEQLIQSKLRKTGTSETITGEGEEDTGEST